MSDIEHSPLPRKAFSAHAHGGRSAHGNRASGKGRIRNRISIAFDDAMFDYIAAMAAERDVPFAAAARALLAVAIKRLRG